MLERVDLSLNYAKPSLKRFREPVKNGNKQKEYPGVSDKKRDKPRFKARLRKDYGFKAGGLIAEPINHY